MLHTLTLETDRLLLRAPTLEDTPTIRRIVDHPDIAKMTVSIRHPYPDDGAVKWINNLTNSENLNYMFLITRKDDNAIMGAIGIIPHPRFKRATLGYWLGLDYWNKGYATEVVRCLIDFGFETLEMERIEGEFFPENPASRRVMEKSGMQFEGIMRHYLQKENVNKDNGICAIIRQDWQKG
jgi:ribosomal-protein-alanine N-acetyltransferase